MAEIALTQGFMALVDDADAAWLGQWRWRYKQHSPRYQGYAVRTTRLAGSPRQVTIYMHRVVFGGDSSEVDHVNRNKLDNRRSNLRAATRAQNAANRACPSGSSPYKGVCRVGRRWRASIRTDGQHRCLGSFGTQEEAARAYDAAARRCFSEFAALNFPDEGAP